MRCIIFSIMIFILDSFRVRLIGVCLGYSDNLLWPDWTFSLLDNENNMEQHKLYGVLFFRNICNACLSSKKKRPNQANQCSVKVTSTSHLVTTKMNSTWHTFEKF